MNTNHVAAILVGLASLAGATAHAAIDTGTMDVSATVSRSCDVTATGMNFGNQNGSQATAASSTVTIDCTGASAGAAPTITFDGGLYAEGGQRRMSSGGGGFIPYNLFSAANSTGPVAVGGSIPIAVTDVSSTYSGTIHGTVAASEAYMIGNYADTVTMTVTYAES